MSSHILILAPQDLLRQVLETTTSLLSRAGKTVRTAVPGATLDSSSDEVSDCVLWGVSDADLSQIAAMSDEAPAVVAVLGDIGLQQEQEQALGALGTMAPMVLRRDVASVAALAPPPLPANRGPRSATKVVPRVAVAVGLDGPTRAGDWGQVIEGGTEGGMRWLVRAIADDEGLKRRKDEEPHIHLQRLMPAQALKGWCEDTREQNETMVSALTALALGSLLGCPLAAMLHGLRDFRGTSVSAGAA